MDYWIIALCAYLALAVVTFVPVIWALLQKVTPKDGGAAFDESPHFTPEQKERLNQHFTRIGGTLEPVINFQRIFPPRSLTSI